MDLFGEVPVSLREIELWLYKVPRLPHGSTRRAAYVRGWNVAHKIARAKAEGWWSEAVPDELCDFCGGLLAADCAAGEAPVSPEHELARLRRRVAVLELLLIPGKEKPGLVSRVSL